MARLLGRSGRWGGHGAVGHDCLGVCRRVFSSSDSSGSVHSTSSALFEPERRRSSPLIVVVLYANSLDGGDRFLHVVREPAEQRRCPRTGSICRQPSTTGWNRSAACDRPVALQRDSGAEPVTAKPLVLVAAAGGGIRAAAWTTYTMTQFDGDCASSAVFLSSRGQWRISWAGRVSSASNGSGGDRGNSRPRRPCQRSSRAPGLRPVGRWRGTAGSVWFDGEWEWRDRSALMESAWLQELAALDELGGRQTALAAPWSADPSGPGDTWFSTRPLRDQDVGSWSARSTSGSVTTRTVRTPTIRSGVAR